MSALVLAVPALMLVAVLAWWLSRRPSHERDWRPEYARLPTATIEGERVLIRNVRNFHYRSITDFDEAWEDREYDLAALQGLDLFFSHWTGPHIAHTILSWPFADGRPLAISVETRRTKAQRYSAIKGFFRQYELMYVVGDERDLIALRAGARREDVYLYRLRVSPLAAKNLLLEYLRAINSVATHPSWYNAALTNCTTTARRRVIEAGGRMPFSWKLLLNGHLPELLYELGSLETSRPFAELKAMSRITERARDVLDRPDFSTAIREGLPQPKV